MLVLGVYAGAIAALITVPVTLPLLARLVAAEVQASNAASYSRVAALASTITSGDKSPSKDWVWIRATTHDGEVLFSVGKVTDELVERTCALQRAALVVPVDGRQLQCSCWRNGEVQVVAAQIRQPRSYFGIGAFVFVLALIAGLVNALGVTQLIRPISRISDALDQVSAGTRYVRMNPTGLHEVDQVIERVNATALAVENRETEILSRVQVIRELARLVAHEVRNPLQSLTLFTQLLVDASERTERLELQASVQEEIKVLDDVVHRLLSEGTTRGALRLQVESVDLKVEFERLYRVRSHEAARRSIQIQVEVMEGLVPRLDRMLFMRSVQNLVTNAMRVVPDGGIVRIGANLEGTLLVVSVDDNGPGVDPDLGERVFELNVTGGKGTGLGLSLTRGVAEAHGGTACFRPSEQLGGARFEIRVPHLS